VGNQFIHLPLLWAALKKWHSDAAQAMPESAQIEQGRTTDGRKKRGHLKVKRSGRSDHDEKPSPKNPFAWAVFLTPLAESGC
jgi:hypothetical protein